MSILKVEVNIDNETRNRLLENLEEEGQTIVHCNYISKKKYINGGWINIHRTTVLKGSKGEEIGLLHVENVPVAPGKYFFKKAGQHKCFTLYFPTLPKDWDNFDLVERTSNGPGFKVHNIRRNSSGVYEVHVG